MPRNISKWIRSSELLDFRNCESTVSSLTSPVSFQALPAARYSGTPRLPLPGLQAHPLHYCESPGQTQSEGRLLYERPALPKKRRGFAKTAYRAALITLLVIRAASLIPYRNQVF